MKNQYFQPGPKCGNCAHYSSPPEEFQSGAYCIKGLNPKTCGDVFKSRNKRKKRVRKIKPWQQERRV